MPWGCASERASRSVAEVAPPAATGVALVQVLPPQVLSVCTIRNRSGGAEKPGHPWCAGWREGELLCAAAVPPCALQALHQLTSGSLYFLFLEQALSGPAVSGPSRAGRTCPIPGFGAGAPAHAGAAASFSSHGGWGEWTCSRKGRWILF